MASPAPPADPEAASGTKSSTPPPEALLLLGEGAAAAAEVTVGLISLSAFDAAVDAGAALEGGADVAEEGFLGSALEEEEDAAGADEDGRALEIALQTIFIHELPILKNNRDSNSVSQT